jgi:hypothetical protein
LRKADAKRADGQRCEGRENVPHHRFLLSFNASIRLAITARGAPLRGSHRKKEQYSDQCTR